jgi:hypothetical protein
MINGVIFTIEKNEITFAGKCMKLKIMLSEICQGQKAKYRVFACMWNLNLIIMGHECKRGIVGGGDHWGGVKKKGKGIGG